MKGETKDPFDTLGRNRYSYFEDLKFGFGSVLLIGGTAVLVGVIGFYAITSLLSLFS